MKHLLFCGKICLLLGIIMAICMHLVFRPIGVEMIMLVYSSVMSALFAAGAVLAGVGKYLQKNQKE